MKRLLIILCAALCSKTTIKAAAVTGGILYSNTVKSQTNSVTRPVDSSTFVVSSDYDSFSYYSIKINCTATIGSPAGGTVTLQYTTDSGANWINASSIENNISASLATLLSVNNSNVAVLCAVIPANIVARLVPSTVGSTTVTFISGQETIDNP